MVSAGTCRTSQAALHVEYICNDNTATPVSTVTSSTEVTNAGSGTYMIDICKLPHFVTVMVDGVSTIVEMTSVNQTISLFCNGKTLCRVYTCML